MKSSTTLALSALFALAMATPIEQAKRDVVIQTIVKEVIVTVDVTTTITGSPQTVVANDKHANHVQYHAHGGAHKSSTPQPAPQPTPATSPPAAKSPEVHQEAYVPAAAPPPTTSSPPPTTPQTPNDIQEDVNEKQQKINDQQKANDFAHQSQMNALQNGGTPAAPVNPPASPTPQVAPQQPAPQPSPQAQSQPQTGGGGGGGGGSCGSIGGTCSGDVTIYNDQGLGACGWTNDTNTEDFFALAAPMFGTYTNDSPGPHKNAFCGRMANIKVGDKTFTGMLTDRCGGCVGQSIDLSQHLFSQLYPNEPPGNGRYHDVEWHFSSDPIFRGAA